MNVMLFFFNKWTWFLRSIATKFICTNLNYKKTFFFNTNIIRRIFFNSLEFNCEFYYIFKRIIYFYKLKMFTIGFKHLYISFLSYFIIDFFYWIWRLLYWLKLSHFPILFFLQAFARTGNTCSKFTKIILIF